MQKLFYIITIVAATILLFFGYRSLCALDFTAPVPKEASMEYLKNIRIFNSATLVSFGVLLIASNLIYFKNRKGIWLLYAWLFFTLFTLAEYIYLNGEHFRFIKQTGVWSGGFEVGFLIGFFRTFVGAIVCIVNYLMLKRMTK